MSNKWSFLTHLLDQSYGRIANTLCRRCLFFLSNGPRILLRALFDKTASFHSGPLISNHMHSGNTFAQSFVHSALFYSVHSAALKKTRRKSTRFMVVSSRNFGPSGPAHPTVRNWNLLSGPVLQLPDCRELTAHHPQALGTPKCSI